MLCSECGLILSLHIGIVDRLELAIICDVFDERLYLTKTSFDLFQVIADTGIGAVNVLNLCFKVGITAAASFFCWV